MITVTNRDTCKEAYIDEKLVQHIEEFTEEIQGRVYPYSTVFIKDPKNGYDYSLDVIESKRKIEQLMKDAKTNPKERGIVYFELGNWSSGKDHPNREPFSTWMMDSVLQFGNDKWCVDNQLCVIKHHKSSDPDGKYYFLIAAKEDWVLVNCPQLLSTDKYSYTATTRKSGNSFTQSTVTKRYSDFVCQPDKNGKVIGTKSKAEFPTYSEENFGVKYVVV